MLVNGDLIYIQLSPMNLRVRWTCASRIFVFRGFFTFLRGEQFNQNNFLSFAKNAE